MSTIKSLRDRWNKQEYIDTLDYDLTIAQVKDLSILNNLDFRGFNQIKNTLIPLWDIPTIINVTVHGFDISHANIALNTHDSELIDIKCIDTKFDRSSYWKKTTFVNADFHKAKLILDGTDVTFINCNFSSSTFKGGFNEYGFRRCKFICCNFTDADWKNLYLLACKFIDCTFDNFKVNKAGIRGFKTTTSLELIQKIFIDCDITGLLHIDHNLQVDKSI
ncbi:MAG: pentapeptide repeat-containing protein [Flavobacteriaceae bacterium]|jgi:uncharacterized protein YjbI with pentapeptide repeats|nr:pentapeptide repeat-containing protein [Flavobacteriaceae bacterium]